LEACRNGGQPQTVIDGDAERVWEAVSKALTAAAAAADPERQP
jgi:hypothetical protein